MLSASSVMDQDRYAKSTLGHSLPWSQVQCPGCSPWNTMGHGQRAWAPRSPLMCPFCCVEAHFHVLLSPSHSTGGWGEAGSGSFPRSQSTTSPSSTCFLCRLTGPFLYRNVTYINAAKIQWLIYDWDKTAGTGDLDCFLSTSVWGGNVCPLRTNSDGCFQWNGHDIEGARCSATTNCYSVKRQIDWNSQSFQKNEHICMLHQKGNGESKQSWEDSPWLST